MEIHIMETINGLSHEYFDTLPRSTYELYAERYKMENVSRKTISALQWFIYNYEKNNILLEKGLYFDKDKIHKTLL